MSSQNNERDAVECINSSLKKHTTISGNKKIDDFVQEMQLNIDDLFEWISYDQFNDIKVIGKGGFATVYSATWKDGPLSSGRKELTRSPGCKVALKCLYNSQNITDEFLNEVKAHSIKGTRHIIRVYGITQNPDTKDYIMVLEYAQGGSFCDWMNKNYKNFDWGHKLRILFNIINGLNIIHQKRMVHRDFHTGNILIKSEKWPSISDMGLCGEVGNMDETKVYGVMPYVAPEVLRRKPYTQAADIYSFGMIMYFTATGRKPFADRAHDQNLALSICNGIRPEINELEIPKCYIDLMERCWNPNPDNRPKATKILEWIISFFFSHTKSISEFKRVISKYNIMIPIENYYELKRQFNEVEEYRKANLLSSETTHSQSIYKSRLLNHFTKDLPEYDNIDNNSLVLDFTQDP